MNRFLFGVVVLSLLLLGCTQQPPATDASGSDASPAGASDVPANQQSASGEPRASASPAEVEADLAGCLERVQGPPYTELGIFTVGSCHGLAAKHSGDSTYCNQVLEFSFESEEAKEKNFVKCVELGEYSEAADCEILQLVVGRDICFHKLAFKVRNAEFCSRIVEDLGEHNTCYSRLADVLEDPSLCAQIDGSPGSCYRDLAVKLGDASLCDFETSETLQEVCQRNVARGS